jgi:glutamate synthase domain-containing protein 1
MCGIVGLFLKDPSLEPKMGQMLTDMLITMSDRGPDSAGIAIYGAVVRAGQADRAGCRCAQGFSRLWPMNWAPPSEATVRMSRKDTHAVLEMPAARITRRRAPH